MIRTLHLFLRTSCFVFRSVLSYLRPTCTILSYLCVMKRQVSFFFLFIIVTWRILSFKKLFNKGSRSLNVWTIFTVNRTHVHCCFCYCLKLYQALELLYTLILYFNNDSVMYVSPDAGFVLSLPNYGVLGPMSWRRALMITLQSFFQQVLRHMLWKLSVLWTISAKLKPLSISKKNS